MSQPSAGSLWTTPEHALDYLRRVDTIPRRAEGEATVLELIPANARRILDLGTGAGRLLALVKEAHPQAHFVGLDFSQTMLGEMRRKYGSDPHVELVEHNLEEPLPAMGPFDAIISSFVIHHMVHDRKRALYAEIYALLNPGGVFCNLDHVNSPSEKLHTDFLKAIHREVEDPENKLLDLQTQVRWLNEIGFHEADCYWKWREFALFAGVK